MRILPVFYLLASLLFFSKIAAIDDTHHYIFHYEENHVLAVTHYAHWVIDIDFTYLKPYLDHAGELVHMIKAITKTNGKFVPELHVLETVMVEEYEEMLGMYRDILAFYTDTTYTEPNHEESVRQHASAKIPNGQ